VCGAFYSPGATLIVWNSTLNRNTATVAGGAAFVDGSSYISYNTTMEHNRAPEGNTGAGVYCEGSTLAFTNVTFGDNFSGQKIQDILCSKSSPNIYQAKGTKFSIPIIICLDQCDALLVDENDHQTHPCPLPVYTTEGDESILSK